MLTNQSLKTLLGAFAMSVKSSRTFVCTSDCSTVIPQSTALLPRAAGPRPELHPQPQPVLGQGAGQHLHPDQEPQLPREGQAQEAAAAGPWPTSVFAIFIPASSLFYPTFSPQTFIVVIDLLPQRLFIKTINLPVLSSSNL